MSGIDSADPDLMLSDLSECECFCDFLCSMWRLLESVHFNCTFCLCPLSPAACSCVLSRQGAFYLEMSIMFAGCLDHLSFRLHYIVYTWISYRNLMLNFVFGAYLIKGQGSTGNAMVHVRQGEVFVFFRHISVREILTTRGVCLCLRLCCLMWSDQVQPNSVFSCWGLAASSVCLGSHLRLRMDTERWGFQCPNSVFFCVGVLNLWLVQLLYGW